MLATSACTFQSQALLIPPVLAQRSCLMAQLQQSFPITSHLLGTSVPHLASSDMCDVLSVSMLHVISVCLAHTGCSVMFIQQQAGGILCFFGPHILAYEMEGLHPMVEGAYLPWYPALKAPNILLGTP